jgi:transcription initiation factor TFIIH subunit 2
MEAAAAAAALFAEDDGAGGEDVDPGEAAAELAAFERTYEDERSWEALAEDEHGRLRAPDDGGAGAAARRRRALAAAAAARVRRGLIRYVQLVLDLSRAAGLQDMRPVRAAAMAAAAEAFVRAFFDENPLSQLGVVALRDGVATQLTELSSSAEAHVAALRASLDTSGDASLQNALDLSTAALSAAPPYGHREVLILLAALSTCDPGDVAASGRAAAAARVRVSVVGLAAEVHVCRALSRATGGTYGVALDEEHLGRLMLAHAPPPPAAPGAAGASLVRMGFPARAPDAPGAAAFLGERAELRAGGFECPRCRARVAALPCQCHVCGLTLVSSPHLARSYHHLFPVPPFEEVGAPALPAAAGVGGSGGEGVPGVEEALPPEVAGQPHCYGCLAPLGGGRGGGGGGASALRCPGCRRLFCADCDAFVHEQLHNCPACEALPPRAEGEDDGGER